jgi:hypothetical protein
VLRPRSQIQEAAGLTTSGWLQGPTDKSCSSKSGQHLNTIWSIYRTRAGDHVRVAIETRALWRHLETSSFRDWCDVDASGNQICDTGLLSGEMIVRHKALRQTPLT